MRLRRGSKFARRLLSKAEGAILTEDWGKRMQLAGIGRVMFWEGGSLRLALIKGGNGVHLHHAKQISLPLAGTVRFRRSQSEPWTDYPARPTARFRRAGRVAANILFEPECAAGRALIERYGTSGIAPLSAAEVARMVGPLASTLG